MRYEQASTQLCIITLQIKITEILKIGFSRFVSDIEKLSLVKLCRWGNMSHLERMEEGRELC